MTAHHPAHHTALYTDEIHRLRSEIANLRRWSASALRDTLISEREQRVEELVSSQELVEFHASQVEELAAEAVEAEIVGEVEILADACEELRRSVTGPRWSLSSQNNLIVGRGLGVWSVLIWREGRHWAGHVVGVWWDEEMGEERHGRMTNARSASPVTTALLLLSAMAARAERAAA